MPPADAPKASGPGRGPCSSTRWPAARLIQRSPPPPVRRTEKKRQIKIHPLPSSTRDRGRSSAIIPQPPCRALGHLGKTGAMVPRRTLPQPFNPLAPNPIQTQTKPAGGGVRHPYPGPPTSCKFIKSECRHLRYAKCTFSSCNRSGLVWYYKMGQKNQGVFGTTITGLWPQAGDCSGGWHGKRPP